jgi:DNA-binding MarR family transcriptional regulator
LPTRDPETFGFLVTDLTRLLRAELDRRTSGAGLGLTPGDGRTLAQAARAGAVRQSVLAERVGVEAMTLSGSLDRLEAQGLIERRPDPADRRAKLVVPTPAGIDVLERIEPIAKALRCDAASGLGEAEWLRFMEMLKLVRTNLTAARAEGVRKESPQA